MRADHAERLLVLALRARLRRASPSPCGRSSCRCRSHRTAQSTSARSRGQVERAPAASPNTRRVHEDSNHRPTASSTPIRRDPQLDDRLRAAAQAERVGREVRELERAHRQSQSDRSHGGSTASLRMLEALGLPRRTGRSPTAGERLASLFHESDLLLAEAIGRKLLDDLDPAAMAGLVSCFTYEHRSPEAPPAPWFPRTRCATGGDPSLRWHAS